MYYTNNKHFILLAQATACHEVHKKKQSRRLACIQSVKIPYVIRRVYQPISSLLHVTIHLVSNSIFFQGEGAQIHMRLCSFNSSLAEPSLKIMETKPSQNHIYAPSHVASRNKEINISLFFQHSKPASSFFISMISGSAQYDLFKKLSK